jgi:transcriptional regulator with XRE-family HTH domain
MSTLQDRARQAVAAGFRPVDMARAAGVSAGAVSQWLSGNTRALKAEAALGLARLTGWSAQWWVNGIGLRENPSPKSGPPKDPPLFKGGGAPLATSSLGNHDPTQA